MNRSLITAANTMGQIQIQLDTIANNVSNWNTTGFKKTSASFSELLYQEFQPNRRVDYEVGRDTPLGIRTGVGALVSTTDILHRIGSPQTTDRSLDVMLNNAYDFLRVGVPDGNGNVQVRYTRDGSLALSTLPNENGLVQLVTSEGYPLLTDGNEPVYLPADATGISIRSDGTIYCELPDNTIVETKLSIANFSRPQLLQKMGDNTYALQDLEGTGIQVEDVYRILGAGEGSIAQGMLEMSTVDLGGEFTDLIAAQRVYQLSARAVQYSNDMLGMVNSLRK